MSEIFEGDCVEVMAGFDAESVDAVVTDPPYDLTTGRSLKMSPLTESRRDSAAARSARGFMGKAWDGTGVAFRPETWAAMWRVAKPSAYLLAFGGTRTVHRMTTAIEDAGWIIRDMLVWAYASGFPKSKASLKPAWEPIVMARKPGPLRMLAIDSCRIPGTSQRWTEPRGMGFSGGTDHGPAESESVDGRWPANVILTDPIFDGDTPGVVGGGEASTGGSINGRPVTGYSKGWADERFFESYGDAGTYSRFFLIPKADRTDREPVLRTDREPVLRTDRGVGALRDGLRETLPRRNAHPTVKPTDLMRHLVRLVTPQDGLVLDPFLGSGTTALACEMEGFRWLGIEKEPEYVAIARARLLGTQRGLGLVG